MPRAFTVLAALLAAWPVLLGASPSEDSERVAARAGIPDAGELEAVVSGQAAREAVHGKAGAAAAGFPDWRVDPETCQARSVGAPNDGRLVNGVPLPEEGPGFVRYHRDTHYGTDETIAIVRWLGARLESAFPGTAPMLIGDISKEGGGRLHPHSSHRTGRDVDIGFFEKSNEARSWFNGGMGTDDVDYDKTWFLLELLLLTGRVEYVFVEQSRIPGLVEAARSYGWTEEAIDRAFLMPDESGYGGVIRHAGGHDAHFHVRFRCPESSTDCESY